MRSKCHLFRYFWWSHPKYVFSGKSIGHQKMLQYLWPICKGLLNEKLNWKCFIFLRFSRIHSRMNKLWDTLYIAIKRGRTKTTKWVCLELVIPYLLIDRPCTHYTLLKRNSLTKLSSIMMQRAQNIWNIFKA